MPNGTSALGVAACAARCPNQAFLVQQQVSTPVLQQPVPVVRYLRQLLAGLYSVDVCLQEPPPPGYQLYAGVGEPVSDSSLVKGPLQVPGKVFQLVCEHYRSVPVRTGASYVGFYDRLDRSSGFQSYPREWDSHEYEAVAGVVASVSFIGSDQIWGKEQ